MHVKGPQIQKQSPQMVVPKCSQQQSGVGGGRETAPLFPLGVSLPFKTSVPPPFNRERIPSLHISSGGCDNLIIQYLSKHFETINHYKNASNLTNIKSSLSLKV